jgi:hypothetical protein
MPSPGLAVTPRRTRRTGIAAKVEQDLQVADNGDNPVTAMANAKYYHELKEAILTVLDHPYFEDVTEASPVGIFSGGDMKGHKHVFCQKDFTEAMKNTRLYEAACNFWRGPYLLRSGDRRNHLIWGGMAVQRYRSVEFLPCCSRRDESFARGQWGGGVAVRRRGETSFCGDDRACARRLSTTNTSLQRTVTIASSVV